MNFLAHLHLSGASRELMVGNFIGDFVKGNPKGRFPAKIIDGIRLHRQIDEFTDSHEIFLSSKNRIRSKYRHYSGVVIDIFYDHFLAVNWSHYSNVDLAQFADLAYATLESFEDILPDKVLFMLPYMKKDNWLVQYATLDGIDKALYGMSRRTRKGSRLDEAIVDLKYHYEDLQQDFSSFYPELSQFCEGIIDSYNQNS